VLIPCSLGGCELWKSYSILATSIDILLINMNGYMNGVRSRGLPIPDRDQNAFVFFNFGSPALEQLARKSPEIKQDDSAPRGGIRVSSLAYP
jgi:hypothetical protein